MQQQQQQQSQAPMAMYVVPMVSANENQPQVSQVTLGQHTQGAAMWAPFPTMMSYPQGMLAPQYTVQMPLQYYQCPQIMPYVAGPQIIPNSQAQVGPTPGRYRSAPATPAPSQQNVRTSQRGSQQQQTPGAQSQTPLQFVYQIPQVQSQGNVQMQGYMQHPLAAPQASAHAQVPHMVQVAPQMQPQTPQQQKPTSESQPQGLSQSDAKTLGVVASQPEAPQLQQQKLTPETQLQGLSQSDADGQGQTLPIQALPQPLVQPVVAPVAALGLNNIPGPVQPIVKDSQVDAPASASAPFKRSTRKRKPPVEEFESSEPESEYEVPEAYEDVDYEHDEEPKVATDNDTAKDDISQDSPEAPSSPPPKRRRGRPRKVAEPLPVEIDTKPSARKVASARANMAKARAAKVAKAEAKAALINAKPRSSTGNFVSPSSKEPVSSNGSGKLKQKGKGENDNSDTPDPEPTSPDELAADDVDIDGPIEAIGENDEDESSSDSSSSDSEASAGPENGAIAKSGPRRPEAGTQIKRRAAQLALLASRYPALAMAKDWNALTSKHAKGEDQTDKKAPAHPKNSSASDENGLARSQPSTRRRRYSHNMLDSLLTMSPLSTPVGFACPECNKVFKFRKHCRRHMVNHTGSKPFKCHICERTFVRKDTCQRHSASCTSKPKPGPRAKAAKAQKKA